METILAIITALGLYSQTFVVTDVSETENAYVVTCEDITTENIWEFTSPDGDWDKGDLVSAIMYNNGTESIYDDEFVSVRYIGNIY